MNRKSFGIVTILASIGAQTHAGVEVFTNTVKQFAVLGGSTVTSTGPTVITGALGVWTGTAITGFPPGIVTGTVHAGSPVAQQAQGDAGIAYTALAGMTPTQILTGVDLGGMTLTPGVYSFATSAALTGSLTLDAQGDPNAIFVFQMGTTLTTANSASIITINGASGGHIFWQVGSSAIIGGNTAFKGSIVALASVTLNSGATILNGRAIALTGGVTMSSNRITSGYVAATCYPNCDLSVGTPTLNANDFQCFLDRFAAGQSYANCDGNGGLNANDFQCFLNRFAGGCN